MSLSALKDRLRHPRLLWLWVWLLLAAGLLASNRELFRTPAHEEGDDAANALSIERAKYGRELHGNYSRFGFHHPGPAFFYTYAAGEWVLLDALHAVPLRHNAHILTGALLQALFLAGAIGLLARQAARPALAAAALTAACVLHFAFVPGAFVGVWPPYVLMGPTACLLAACAAVAAAQPAGWPWLLLSAGYLLHGHVAQPMFVGPLALAAFALAWLRPGAPGGGRWSWLPRGRTAIASAVLVALFALPLLIDLAEGLESNLAAILVHVRYSDAATRPGWGAAILYTLSYFGYCVTQENWWFNRASGTPADFLRQHGAQIACWIALAAVLAAWLRRRRTGPDARRDFAGPYALLLCLEFVLAVFWAKRQDDGITYFNSYFLFGLMFAVLGLAVLAAFERLFPGEAAEPAQAAPGGRGRRGAVAAILALSAGAFAFGMPRIRTAELEANARANAVAVQVPKALAADTMPGVPKLIVFEQDSWYEAVTVAATLQRRGVLFKVPEPWTCMFGAEHVLKNARAASRPESFSWWRVEVPSASASQGSHVIGLNLEGQLRLIGIPPALGPLPATLRFSDTARRRAFLPLGCDSAEEDFAWTLGWVTVLRASVDRVDRDVLLDLTAAALMTNRIREQRVILWADGERLGQVAVSGKDRHSLRIPREVWNRSVRRCGYVQLALELPDARVPAQIGKSNDRRRLALQLFEIQLTLAPAAAAEPTPAGSRPGQP